MDLKYQSVLVSRPLAKFHPDVWGTCFLSFIPKSNAETQAKEQLVEGLKEGIKRELKETSNDYMRQLRMVDEIQRLGIEYHFEEEVDQTLESIFVKYHDFCKKNHDIHSTSLSFRLLRQHGYRVSCEIFEKFKDVKGDFMVPNPRDVMGLLEFYEATHLRIRGEDVLDCGFLFAKKYLESILPSLSNPLAEQVHHALKECSNRRGIPRLEARLYISIYGQHASHHQGLLKLAKLDFNRLQSFHKEELGELCRWWRDLEVPTKLSYARDRLVETYFWDSGVYFEPKYAIARKILTKTQAIISLIDDTYDAYGTFEELEVFTKAIERWSFSCLKQLPNNMKIVYKALLELFEEIAEEMDKQGTSYRVSYGKEAVKYICRAYFAEIKWREERYTPTTEEYMRVAAAMSSGITTLIIISFLGIDKHIAPKEAFDWVFSEPDIMRAAFKICRLKDDIGGHEFEQKRDHIPSSVHCYMNEHKVRKEEAIDELNNQTEEEWKVLNEAFLRPTKIPAPLLYRIINIVRVAAVIYSKGDWYTHVGPEMKSFIQQLFIDPVPEY